MITNIELDPKGISEIEEVTTIKVATEYRDIAFKTTYISWFNQIWGDFAWLRSLFTEKDLDIRAFATSETLLRKAGVDKSHMGMYDTMDQDGVLDFYFGIPAKLDRRAKANGFRTNLAWLFVHEMLHGIEQLNKRKDRVHAMEAQGRLKELWNEYVQELEVKVSMLQRILELTKTLIGLKKN